MKTIFKIVYEVIGCPLEHIFYVKAETASDALDYFRSLKGNNHSIVIKCNPSDYKGTDIATP